MKLFYRVMLCLLVVIGTNSEISAENVFPEFTLFSQDVHIPIDILKGYQEDLAHESGVYVAYGVNGQFFTEPTQGHIQTLAEGFSGTSDRSTPWKTLTELLAAYQNQNVEAIRGLYTTDSHAELDELLTDPDIKDRFMNFLGAIVGMEVQLGFEHKAGFLAIVKLSYTDGLHDLTPFYFVQSGPQWLLSAVVLDEAIDSNIAVFLQQDHTVEELLQPPDPQHTLTIEKGGDGDGVVFGSGIDCGEDCVEIFREGTLIYLKAIPDADSRFDGWLMDGQTLEGKLEIQQNSTVTAIFTAE